jgi:hypothetical protein
MTQKYSKLTKFLYPGYAPFYGVTGLKRQHYGNWSSNVSCQNQFFAMKVSTFSMEHVMIVLQK